MIELYDDASVVTHFIDTNQLKRILKKDRSSSTSGNTYDIKLTYKDGETLDIVLDDANVAILIDTVTN